MAVSGVGSAVVVLSALPMARDGTKSEIDRM
jgi:hypothetical protein